MSLKCIKQVGILKLFFLYSSAYYNRQSGIWNILPFIELFMKKVLISSISDKVQLLIFKYSFIFMNEWCSCEDITEIETCFSNLWRTVYLWKQYLIYRKFNVLLCFKCMWLIHILLYVFNIHCSIAFWYWKYHIKHKTLDERRLFSNEKFLKSKLAKLWS